MTVGELKRILEASPDDGAEVNISGFDMQYRPEDIEYVMTFFTGEIWIVSNIITIEEFSKK